MSEYVINGLVKKRAMLAGDIENTKDALAALVDSLQKLDATILLFDPDYKIEGIKPKAFRVPEDWSKRGEMTRVILDLLRNAREPLAPRDIALSLMELKGMNRADIKLVRTMTKRAGAALRHARDKGLVEAEQGPGLVMLWRLDTAGPSGISAGVPEWESR